MVLGRDENDHMKLPSFLTTLTRQFKALSRFKQILLGVVVIGLIYSIYPKPDKNQVSYQTATITTGQVTEIISETGEIMSTGMTEVVSTTNGIVQEVYVENGQDVKRGAKLYYVESSATAEERAKASAAYLSAKNALSSAESSSLTLQSTMFAKQEEFRLLNESGDYSDENSQNQILPAYTTIENDWLASEAKYIDQQDVIQAATTSLNQAYLAYLATVDSVVTAPIAGQIANLAIAPGQSVSGTNSSLIIASREETWVELSVSEADITPIAPDQDATVSVDSLSGETFEAIVKRVDQFGTDSSGVVIYNVYLVLTDPSDQILPAMTVQVDITTAHADEVVVVDNSAIKPYQGGKAVQVMGKSGNNLIYLPITLGLTGSTHSEVTTGLEVGDEIIVSQSTDSSDKASSGGIFGAPGGGSK